MENLITLKENKTKISFTPISNVNLDNIKESGYYISPSWGNNISGLPSEINGYSDKAFYLQVFALNDINSYCQQILYSFKSKIFYRAITGAGGSFSNTTKFIISLQKIDIDII
jgi:hypothetical protein|nr:MAG TPA: hypothetical protein [Caudoviricetes sp.]